MEVCFQNLDPHLSAEVIDTEFTHLGARAFGAKVLGRLRRRRRRGGDMTATSTPGSLAPSLAPGLLALRWCFKPAPNLPGQGFFLFFLLPLRFLLFPLRPTSRIGILDLGNFDLICRSSRAMYHHSPPSFFQIDLVYISQIFQPKNHHYLGFMKFLIFVLYNRRMPRREKASKPR